ncbi:MAG: right-handed parallel beta-helix repeat-containing protein, partial [Patescibacteria group bacterium]
MSTYNGGGKGAAGDTIYFCDEFTAKIYSSLAGTSDSHLLLRGDYAGHPYLVGATYGSSNTQTVQIKKDYTDVTGFTINISAGSNTTVIYYDTVAGGSHGRAYGNTITMTNTGGYPMQGCPTCTVEFDHNTINGGPNGIHVEGSNNSIHDNTINSALTYCVLAKTGGSNSVYSNNLSGCSGEGVQLLDSSNNNIYGNTIATTWNGLNYGSGGAGSGIDISGSITGSNGNNIYGNKLTNNHVGILMYNHVGTDANVIWNNIIWNSRVNSISVTYDGNTNPNYFYNNDINVNTVSGSNPTYVGHGIACQANCSRIVIANNSITMETNNANANGVFITTSTPFTSAKIDYNNYWSTVSGGVIGSVNGAATTITDLRTRLQSDNKITDLGGNLTPEAHGTFADPLFTSASDLHITNTSPAIDAGTDVSLTTDYAGNPIYGTPDIGAYEYQPPYTVGSNAIPQTGSIRIYSDGQYRALVATTTADTITTSNFSVVPAGGGFYTASTSAFMDLNINTWETAGDKNKSWTATSSSASGFTHATSTVYTIGDLAPDSYYTFKIDNTATTTAITGYGATTCQTSYGNGTNLTCLSDSSGIVQFTYSGGYSTHTFELEKDITRPAIFTASSPANNTVNSDSRPTLSWNASSDTESGIAKYQLYIDNTLDSD